MSDRSYALVLGRKAAVEVLDSRDCLGEFHWVNTAILATAGIRSGCVQYLPGIPLVQFRRGTRSKCLRVQKHRPGFGILDITAETAEHYAGLRLELKRAGTPIPVRMTLWIAALCREHQASGV